MAKNGAVLVKDVRQAIYRLLDYLADEADTPWKEGPAKMYVRMLAGVAGDDWQGARLIRREAVEPLHDIDLPMPDKGVDW